MKNKPRKGKQMSRRSILPILGSSLLFPFLGFGNPTTTIDRTTSKNTKNEEYQTLLKPDGTSVKVKKSTIQKSKIVKKNISNKSFLNWLGKKL